MGSRCAAMRPSTRMIIAIPKSAPARAGRLREARSLIVAVEGTLFCKKEEKEKRPEKPPQQKKGRKKMGQKIDHSLQLLVNDALMEETPHNLIGDLSFSVWCFQVRCIKLCY
eukprot:gene11577-7974_t